GGQAARVEERGFHVDLAWRVVPVAGDEGVPGPGGRPAEGERLDLLGDLRDRDLVSVECHRVRRARLGAQHGGDRGELSGGGHLVRSGDVADLLDLHRDRGGLGLGCRRATERGAKADREDDGGGGERDRGHGYQGAGGPGERRGGPEADRGGQ